MTPELEIRHGSLLRFYGRVRQHAGFAIAPADVELAGRSFSMTMPLSEFVSDPVPACLRFPLKHKFEAAWVFARLPEAFGFEPTASEGEKSLLHQGFVAVQTDDNCGYPFICTDYYGRCSLGFSDEGPDSAIQRRIAESFWRLLLQSPDELTDFEARVMHLGSGMWLNFGCRAGDLVCDETAE